MSIKQRILFFALIACCCIDSAAQAEGNIRFGRTELHPYLSVEETFSDNVYYTSTEARRDSITTTTPGIKIVAPFRVHVAELEYYSVINNYQRYRLEDTTDQNGRGLLDLKLGSRFGLKLTDVYAKSHEARSSSSTGFIEKYTTNTASASATYQLADVSKLRLDYGETALRFTPSKFRNRHEDLAAGYFFYRIMPKTSVFVEYDRKKVTFQEASFGLDNNMDSVQAGLTWEITEKTKGTVKAGTVYKNFKSPDLKDYRGATGQADIKHAFTEYTSLTLVGERVVNETNLLGTSYFITTGFSAELTHRFVKKVTGMVRGMYGTDAFADSTQTAGHERTDHTNAAGAGLKYAMRDWLEFSLNYDMRERHSNFPANDYREHSTSLMAAVAL